MHRVVGPFALLTLLAMFGCETSSVEADFTGISLYTSFEAEQPVSEIHVTGKLDDDSPAFQMGITPVSDDPAIDGLKTELLVILLQADKSGQRVRIHVEGRDVDGALVGAADDTVRLRLGYFRTSSVSLSVDVLCGNGVLDAPETCDDGNRVDGDGCNATCVTDSEWICIAEPSHCTPASRTALVDAAAQDCPGTGTAETPFCAVGRAVEAPWAQTLAVRAGTYDEDLVISRDLELWAASGARLQSLNSPALSIEAEKVMIDGLRVTGINRVGGGISIGGQGQVTLQEMTMGPSSTIGVSISESVLVRVENSWITGNAGGGLQLDSDRGYIASNLFITDNGNPEADFGGVDFVSSPTNSIFSNNTVANNEARNPATAGVRCGSGASLLNTIIWDSGTLTSSATELCHFEFCDLGPIAPDVVLEDGNFSSDPLFEMQYRLGPGSPCIDRGDPGSIADDIAPSYDFEGEIRPQGPNIDVGADEAS